MLNKEQMVRIHGLRGRNRLFDQAAELKAEARAIDELVAWVDQLERENRSLHNRLEIFQSIIELDNRNGCTLR